MAEISLVHYVMRGMRGRWEKPVKHADAYTAGIADLSGFIMPAGNVFIELKAIAGWPKRPGTAVWFGLDALQRDFLVRRRGYLFVRVGREYLLYLHHDVAKIDREEAPLNASQLVGLAVAFWSNKVNWTAFAGIIGGINYESAAPFAPVRGHRVARPIAYLPDANRRVHSGMRGRATGVLVDDPDEAGRRRVVRGV